MTTEGMGAQALEQVLVGGDLSRLSPTDRMVYYTSICDSLGLNPLTKPLDYITLNGKMTLYAKRDCTDQLRKINGVSITIASREVVEDCYIVIARATDRTGRSDESIGSVPIGNVKGESRSNAMMKAETKAKRRVTLSICGMGLLDETEVLNLVPSPLLPETLVKTVIEFKEGEEEKIEDTINHVYRVRKFIVSENIKDAYSYCETLPADVKKDVWLRLDADERILLKEHKEGLAHAELP